MGKLQCKPLKVKRFSYIVCVRVIGLFVLILGGLAGGFKQNVLAAPRLDPVAGVTFVGLPGSIPIGSDFSFTVRFDNTDATDVGYGPFVDLFLPKSGTDGTTGGPNDGITFTSASYLGAGLTLNTQDCPAGGSVTHYLTGELIVCPSQPAGLFTPFIWELTTIQLPFGSFTNDQPPADITINAHLSDHADLNVLLPLQVRGGFMYGKDPLDNPATDPPIYGAMTNNNPGTDATLITLSKTYHGPEDETATGPNFPREYTITATIAPGQSLTDFRLMDYLPDNLQYLTLVSASPGIQGVDWFVEQEPTTGAPQNPPDNDLVIRWPGPVSGTVTMRFRYYVPRYDANGAIIINADTGDDVRSDDDAKASGDWQPIDPRDLLTTITSDLTLVDHRLWDKSIAIQKGVTNMSASPVSPGDVLQYTLLFQISDYFAFEDIVITDIFSDGQRWNAAFTPTLSLTEHGSNTSGTMNSANFSYVVDSPGTGTTTATFNISDELISRALNGQVLGGCVPDGGGSVDCSTYDGGGTVATLVFQTIVQEDFSDDYPSTDPSVDQGDKLDNGVTIEGDVLDNAYNGGSPLAPTGFSEADTSGAGVSIPYGSLFKYIFAINGNTSLPSPLRIAPGDEVTYRIRYVMPTADEEQLELSDYFPLPIFHVGDPDSDGVPGPAWYFTDGSPSSTIPAPGEVRFGPTDTFRDYTTRGGTELPLIPTLTADTIANSLTFFYGSFDDTRNQGAVIDLLFTVTVSDDPFADGLFLTNQAHAFEGSTNAGDQSANAIVQLQLTEPVLNIKKGVVATNNAGGVFNPVTVGPVSFTAPGSAGVRFIGTITSGGLAATPINSNLSGLDAGDLVTFAVVIENTGRGLNGAYDVQIKDTIPPGMSIPSGGAGLNLSVTDGSGAAIAYTDLGGGFFANGIELTDPGPTDPPSGALDPGKDSSDLVINTGRNIAVITYDLVLDASVEPRSIYTNTASLLQYAGREGGENHITSPKTDDATVTVVDPSVTKTITGTTEPSTLGNNVAIGEGIGYQVVISIPEGTSSGVTLVDTLSPGMAFVDCITVTRSSTAISASGWDFTSSDCSASDGTLPPANPIISNNGGTATWDFGTITNNDTNNGVAETITINYSVVMLNVTGNDRNVTRTNSARWQWSGGSVTRSAPNLTIVEPTLQVSKTPNPNHGDAGDTITFTVTISHAAASNADAFDVSLTDTIPAGMTYVAGSLAPVAASQTPASLTYSGGVITGSWAGIPRNSGSPPPPYNTAAFTFQVTLDGSVFPGQTIDNYAYIQWTSLPGDVTTPQSPYNTVSTERTGNTANPGGNENDYRANNYGRVTVDAVAPVKSLVTTSEAHSGIVGGLQRVAIGEIVRYRLQVQLSETTSTTFNLRDYIPAGMFFINDGTAKAAFVSDDGDITCATSTATISSSNPNIGTNPWICGNAANIASIVPTFVLPNEAVSSLEGSDNDTYNDSTDVYFKFGTVINNDRDAGLEYVVVEFNAQVGNVVGNQNSGTNGTQLRNNFRVRINGSDRGTSNNIDVYVAEPAISVTKSIVAPAPVDAGDTITYDIVFTNGNDNRNLDAFNLRLEDTLNVHLQRQSQVVQSNPSGATIVDNSSGNKVDMTVNRLNKGQSITIRVTALVLDTVPSGYTIPNTAQVTYTSLPDNGTRKTDPANTTGSENTGSTGTATGERDGITVPLTLNDYLGSGSVQTTLSTPTVQKLEVTPKTQYTIGETVTYNIQVNLPEGVTQSVFVIDELPVGLAYIPGSIQVITSPAADNPLVEAFSGSWGGAYPVLTAPGGNGDDVQLEFGDISVPGDASTNNSSFIVRFQALVLDVSTNQAGITLQNYGNLRYTNPNTGVQTLRDGPRNITIVEPRIATEKIITNPAGTVQAGDEVTYQVTFTNTGTATAYDVTAEDTLTQGVLYKPASVSCVDQNGTAVAVTLTDNTTSLSFDGNPPGAWDIPATEPDSYIRCTYIVIAQSSIWLNGSHTNTVDADWTSLDGPQPGVERNYNDPTPPYDMDGTQDTDDATFSAIGPTLQKNDGGITTRTIGDTLTYTLTIGGPLGTYRNLVVSDVLPAGLIYTGNVVISGLPAVTPTISAPNDGSAAVTVTFDFDDAYKSAENATIVFTARVANVVGNQQGGFRTNTARLDHDDAQGNPQPRLTATDSFTIVEPVISINKSILVPPTPPDAGGVVTYRIVIENPGGANVSTAYDVVVTDTLPASLHLDAITSIVPENGVSGPITSLIGGNYLEVEVAAIPVTGRVTIDLTATILSVTPGLPVNNLADVTWTSRQFVDDNERTGDDGAGGALNDYAASDDVEFNIGQPVIDKYLFSTSAAHTTNPSVTIGEVATYDILVTLIQGVTDNLSVVDLIPSGMDYTGYQIITAPGAGNLLTDTFSGSPTPPIPTSVTDPGGDGADVTFNFPSITLPADNDTDNNAFIIRVSAVVLDVPGNVGLPPGNTVLRNQAELRIAGAVIDTSPQVSTPVVEPQMTISKTIVGIPGNNVGPGDVVTFQLVVGNSGASTAFDVIVEDPLPHANANITFDPATIATVTTPAGFSFTTASVGDNTVVRYSGGSIDPGSPVTFTFEAIVSTVIPGLGITNRATVTQATTLDGADAGERDEPDVFAEAPINGYAIDPAITKTDNDAHAVPGNTLTYHLTVSNLGNRTATGVVVTESLPAYTTFNAGASTPGWSCVGSICTFNIASLPSGAWAGNPLVFAVTVNNPVPTGVDQLTNIVNITDDGLNGVDVDPNNNDDYDDTPLDAVPDLTIVKDDGLTQVGPGATITYTLTIDNIGNQDATGVAVKDTLPTLAPTAYVTFVSASDGGTYNPATGEVTWPLFNLAVNDPAVTRTVTVTVNDPATTLSFENVAEVADDGSNGPDPNTGNNVDTDIDQIRSGSKAVTDHNQAQTVLPSVAIGEVITYSVVMNIAGDASLANFTLSDIMDRGLAFVRCVDISAPNLVASRAFDTICNTPLVSRYPAASTEAADDGRAVTFNFGTLTNTGHADSAVTIRYEVVVLDNAENLRDLSLNNAAMWQWDGGAVPVAAGDVTIVEPTLQLSKTVDNTVVAPGGVATFTLTLQHTAASNDDAYDVNLADQLPIGLGYVTGSFETVSGQAPLLSFPGPGQLRMSWAVFTRGGPPTVLRFKAQVKPGTEGEDLINRSNVEWTSLPGDYRTPPLAPISPYNTLSTERYYDPLSPVNVYGTAATAVITVPSLLPATGFAPNRVTLLPPQSGSYTSLGNIWLEIPDLGIELPIVGVPYGENGWDLTWLDDQAGYLEGTTFPSWEGNSGITAHVYDADGNPGPFVNLNAMQYGQQIILHVYGLKYVYEVRQVLTLAPNDLSVLRHEDYAWVTLLTCQGYNEASGTYRSRVAVRAVLVNVDFE